MVDFNITAFRGDDLTDIITINRPNNTDELIIEKQVVQVGDLVYTQNNPTYPYNITIDRTKSIDLDYKNDIYSAIYYKTSAEATTNIRRTLVGTLTMLTNKKVVLDD